MSPRDGMQPFFGMREGQIAEAFDGKVLDDGVENTMGGIGHVAGIGGCFQRATEPSKFVAMQKTVRGCGGAQHGVGAHCERWR